MLQRVPILYCFAWIFYAVFTVTGLPLWDITRALLSIPLRGFEAWIYGSPRGLELMIPAGVYMYCFSNKAQGRDKHIPYFTPHRPRPFYSL